MNDAGPKPGRGVRPFWGFWPRPWAYGATGDFTAVDSLGLAVAVFEQGGFLRDWHTVQTVPSAAAKLPQSRSQALAAAAARQALKTAITKRDYRVGPLYGIAVWNGDLSRLARALEQVELPPWQVKAKADILATTPEVLQSERTIRTECLTSAPMGQAEVFS